MKAIWVPGWHQLDQSLEGGERRDFAFVASPVEKISHDLVFFNRMAISAPYLIRSATIEAIHHPVLGGIRRIDTKGLDYTIALDDDTVLVVNYDESPGTVTNSDCAIDDWTCHVSLSDVGVPHGESRVGHSDAVTEAGNGNRGPAVRDLALVKYDEGYIPNPPPSGQLSTREWDIVGEALAEVCARYGKVYWADTPSEPDFQFRTDPWSHELYHYMWVRPSHMTTAWLSDIAAALRDYEPWGVGILNIEDGYMLVFGSKVMVNGDIFSDCSDTTVAVDAARQHLYYSD